MCTKIDDSYVKIHNYFNDEEPLSIKIQQAMDLLVEETRPEDSGAVKEIRNAYYNLRIIRGFFVKFEAKE